jgi:hypothetical protein
MKSPGCPSYEPWKKVVLSHFDQRGKRSVRRDVAADGLVVLVRPHHHRERIPPNVVLDMTFEETVARVGHFLIAGDAIDVRRDEFQRGSNAELGCSIVEALKEVRSPVRPSLVDHLIQGVQPLASFEWVEVL